VINRESIKDKLILKGAVLYKSTEPDHNHALPRDDISIFVSRQAPILSKAHAFVQLPLHIENRLVYTGRLEASEEIYNNDKNR
jgi:hypothetical protein